MPPDIDDIISIQRKTSNRTWVVSFFRTVAKDAAMQLPSIKITARSFSVLVKIYEAPDELPDTIVIGRLSHYGKVLSFRHDLLTTGSKVDSNRHRHSTAHFKDLKVKHNSSGANAQGKPNSSDSGANAQVLSYSVVKSALPTKENVEVVELENSQDQEDIDSSVSLKRKSPSDSHSSPPARPQRSLSASSRKLARNVSSSESSGRHSHLPVSVKDRSSRV